MLPPDIEYEIQLLVTQSFVDAKPTELLLRRQEFADDGAGGKILALTGVEASATVHMIPVNTPLQTAQESRNNYGTVNQQEFILVGMPDCGVQQYDRFSYKNIEWMVTRIHLSPDYELKADASIYSQGA